MLNSRIHKSLPYNNLLGSEQEKFQRLFLSCGLNRLPKYTSWIPYRTSPGPPKKPPPLYFKFVSTATLWDRGVYHYTNKQPNASHNSPCPRFIAHMATSPDEQHHSKIASNKSPGHPKNGRNLHGKLLSCTNSQSNTPAYMRGRKKPTAEVILPRCVLQKVPKQPLPSMASSDGEPDVTIDDGLAPITSNDAVINTSQNEEERNSTQLILAPEIAIFSKSSETESVYTQELLTSSVHSGKNMEWSKASFHEVNSIYKEKEDSDLSGKVSSCSSLYRSCSTPFSQLLSSSSSLSVNMASKSEAAIKNSSGRVTKQVEKSFRSESERHYSPGLHSSSSLGNPNLEKASSQSVRIDSQDLDFASSFDEMWHDRFLHHWPVLPPISPQRESSSMDEIEKRSQTSEFSNGTQEAFDELEIIAPHTGSSGSPQSGSFASFSSASATCKPIASHTIGFFNQEESLAEVRLALLDHSDCGEESNTVEDANTNEFMTFPEQGHGFPPAAGLPNVLYSPNAYINKGEDNLQKDHNLIGDEEMELKTQEELCHEIESYIKISNNKVSQRSSDMDDAHDVGGTIYDEDNKLDGGNVNHRSVESQRRPLGRKTIKLDHSIRQEMERQMLAEERRAQAVKMYSKLRSSRLTTIRTPQSMSISRFEDFDFLAKYCIFSQEKLAEYKRAFEAVDTDEDGYLDCLQVLMALKEIVPGNALSDAEEFYVYRILEIVDYYVTDGLTDLRLFAVMASLAQKIAALDSFMRSLIDHMDFKALELKMYKAKQLFLCNIDAESKSISVEQLLVELKAGGISREHEEAAQLELSHIKKLDILDFLTYLPLFVLIHNSVISNPLDDSRKI
ncbi:uncharacterized protein LOC122925946 isoform X1 [Bufo gargarizans]|uniref:uncharacterized protein LOC122925946 isoform X1 n=1 Tax=Bufo gargarizans TaxID=30331 RepID=UPI001CF41B20|nr:uncharacterized protein LOC122925946 isoform X1 [Bufo gargarizans]